jgi:hypothetical protein
MRDAAKRKFDRMNRIYRMGKWSGVSWNIVVRSCDYVAPTELGVGVIVAP